MPALQALVEVKTVSTNNCKKPNKKYRRDVAKLALMGEYFCRQLCQPHPYLGAWILATFAERQADEALGWLRQRLFGNPMVGTEHVRVVVFRPGAPPAVLQVGDGIQLGTVQLE